MSDVGVFWLNFLLKNGKRQATSESLKVPKLHNNIFVNVEGLVELRSKSGKQVGADRVVCRSGKEQDVDVCVECDSSSKLSNSGMKRTLKYMELPCCFVS